MQGKGVTEQGFGGVAIKRILVCSGTGIWGRGGSTKSGELGLDPAHAATRGPRARTPFPPAPQAPPPVTSPPSDSRGAPGVYGGGPGPQGASPGIPTGPRAARTGGCGTPIPSLEEIAGAPGPRKGGAEAPGVLRCLARS